MPNITPKSHLFMKSYIMLYNKKYKYIQIFDHKVRFCVSIRPK